MYIIHYWEIAIKWKNRNFFENKLKENINFKLKNFINSQSKVEKKYWKFIIQDTNPQIEEILKTTVWITHFSKAIKSELNIETIQTEILKILKDKNFEKFKINSNRTNKNFHLTSPEINWTIWKYISQKLWKNVDYKNPDIEVFVNIAEKESYIFMEKIKWIWWMPMWTAWKIISLLSWWIDSPVASFQLMRRWWKIILVHAYNKTINPEQVKNKIIKLTKRLSYFQWEIKLYLIPYIEIQKEIVQNSDEKYRMLLFKRSIVRIANSIAYKENAKWIILWDSLWQVASQTLENINTIYSASTLPILSPLISLDKQEIVNIAKKIWTYEISILPYDDCCSLIAWTKPRTKWNPEKLSEIEKKLTIKEIEKNLIKQSEIIRF